MIMGAEPVVCFDKAAVSDIPIIRSLAAEIWHECYPSIISAKQIDYMLGLMYSEAVLRSELSDPAYEYYIVRNCSEAVGYVGLLHEAKPDRTKLTKLYLKASQHGKGIGKKMMEYAKSLALDHGSEDVYLQVNKRNATAIKAYLQSGFAIEREAEFDIGGGFVMDDYVMVCRLDGYIRNPQDCAL